MDRSVMDNPVEHFRGLASEALKDSRISDDEGSVQVTDHYRDASSAVQDTSSVAGELRTTLAKLEEDKVYRTKAGYEKDRIEAIDSAKRMADQAARRFNQSHEAAESAILDSALPRLASDTRENLARQELAVALGDAKGGDAATRILGVAKSGSPEAQAALGTPFARTLLISRGVANVDRTLRDARKAVTHLAKTPEAEKAAANLDKLGQLGGAQAAALAAFRHAMPEGGA